MAIRFRPSYEYLSAALLLAIAHGVVLLVLNSIAAKTTGTGVGLLAAAAGLSLILYRIWRGTTDATRWTAAILAVLDISVVWLRMS